MKAYATRSSSARRACGACIWLQAAADNRAVIYALKASGQCQPQRYQFRHRRIEPLDRDFQFALAICELVAQTDEGGEVVKVHLELARPGIAQHHTALDGSHIDSAAIDKRLAYGRRVRQCILACR